MIPYICVFLVLVSAAIISQIEEVRRGQVVLYVVPVAMLVLFAGLRVSGVGSDDHNYEYIYAQIPSLVDYVDSPELYDLASHRKEFGFLILNFILKSLSGHYTLLFLVCALFSVGFAGVAYQKLSPLPYVSLLLFFVHTFLYRDMNQIRAAMATSVCLFCVPYLGRREYLKACLVILVASVFHIASLAMMLAVVFFSVGVTQLRALGFIVLSIILGYISISSILLSLLPGVDVSIASSVMNYSESEMYSQDLGMWNITNIKSLFIWMAVTCVYRQLTRRVRFFPVMYSLYTLGVCWRLAFSDFAILAGRVATFFEIVEVVLVPCLILALRQRFWGYLGVFTYAALMFYMNMFMVNRRDYQWVLTGWF